MPIVPSQIRFVDPFADIYSDKVNKRLISIFPSGKGVLYGVHGSQGFSPNFLNLSPGCIIKDYVTIHLPQENNLDVAALPDGTYFAVLIYEYHVVQPPPVAQLDIIATTAYDPARHVKICCIDVQNGEVSEVRENCDTCRDCNPLMDVVMDILENGLQGDLDMNGYKIIHLGDPVADHDGVNKQYLESRLDYIVKATDDDQNPNYLSQKMIFGDNMQSQVIEDPVTPGDYKLNITGEDRKVKVTSGDDTKSYI